MHSCGSFVGQARFQFAGLHSLFLDRCICNLLFFELADTFQPACHVNCIYILPFLGFKDTPFANFASTSHIFDNVKMLPSKITHPTCSFNALRILHIKILHLQSPKIHYRRYLSHNILWVLFTSQLEPIHYLQKNWYKKFERIWNGRWWHLERRLLR